MSENDTKDKKIENTPSMQKFAEGGEESNKQRISKVIARSGLCSRREAERWILEGRVKLNGKVLDTPAVTVGLEDKIEVDQDALPQKEALRVWRYHKPVGVLVSDHDEKETAKGRRLLKEVLPPDLPRVLSVGRLDLNSEGLLLLTNDGEFKRLLELPSSQFQRRYRVRVYGAVSEERLKRLEKGITIEGVRYAPIFAEVEKQTGRNAWLIFTLEEGKNREIRRVCTHLGLQVNKLIRLAYGPVHLGHLERGQAIEIPKKQLYQYFGVGTAPKASWAKAQPKPKSRKSASRKKRDMADHGKTRDAKKVLKREKYKK